MSDDLSKMSCQSCRGEIPKLTFDEAMDLLHQLGGEWRGMHIPNSISKHWKFSNFQQPHEFVQAIAAIAEQEDHHPDIRYGWGYLEIMIRTHKIGGLTKNDFILAAKIDAIDLDDILAVKK